MLSKLVLIYVLLLGESFRIMGVNAAIWLIALDLTVSLLFNPTIKRLIPIVILSLSTIFVIHNYPLYYIAQDAFILIVFIWAGMKQWDFTFVKVLLNIALWIMLLKTILIYSIPIDLSWGQGDFLDGNLHDFGLYKRIQIKGGDALLMIYPLFYNVRRLTPSSLVFFILLIFAGSRALFAYTVLILFFQSKLSFLQLIKTGLIVVAIALVLFRVLNFQSRLEIDGGRGLSWRLLETAIVLEEIEGSWLAGNGLGAGFYMPVASGSTLEDGMNLYTHNVISWLLLKGGLFFVGIFLYTLYRNFLHTDSRIKLVLFALIALNLINNYIITFSGILLFTLFIRYFGSQREIERCNSGYALKKS